MDDRILKHWHLVLSIYYIWSVYHLLRDLMQVLKVDTFIANVGTRSHTWCSSDINYCGYLTFPLEIYNLIVIPFVWKRNKIGTPEIIVLFTIPITIIMWLWP